MHRTAKPGHDPRLDGALHRQALIPPQAWLAHRSLGVTHCNNVDLELLSISEITVISAAYVQGMCTLIREAAGHELRATAARNAKQLGGVDVGACAAGKSPPGQFRLSHVNFGVLRAFSIPHEPFRLRTHEFPRIANVAPRPHSERAHSFFSKIFLDRL
jgi:hypothetical protein